MQTQTIGFIGGGNMATSLISGLIASKHPCNHIHVYDIDDTQLQSLHATFNINTHPTLEGLVQHSDIIVLAVKPQIMKSVCDHILTALGPKNPLFISIAAGINQSSLSHWLGKQAIVRCMPNTPALVQTGATALHANNNVSPQQRDLTENILRAVGIALWVDEERLMDTVTAISGSGPAYFFLLMEAMEKSALELGLPEQTARLLIQQTALGAAKIALESGESPESLRKKVTSTGGTTQQAISTFQNGGLETLVNQAVHAAFDRSIEMSTELGEN
ncbi:MAG: pyrroline-5-carboxylate reductase [Methylococcales bacterium]|jgi:pyrroline-5-carboxylate reductase|nr:pyrroline-5-carboxylate reductase [Methylococcales bacterium]